MVPVVCPVCGKSVSGINGKQKLAYHMLTHTGEKNFQCPYCPHRAGLKFNLNRHIRTVHKDQVAAAAATAPQPVPVPTEHTTNLANARPPHMAGWNR